MRVESKIFYFRENFAENFFKKIGKTRGNFDGVEYLGKGA
jgi:hypothetical protein